MNAGSRQWLRPFPESQSGFQWTKILCSGFGMFLAALKLNGLRGHCGPTWKPSESTLEARRVHKLSQTFKMHLGLEKKFMRSDKIKGWNKVSLYGYECWRFAELDENGVSKIEKVVREVWPDGAGIVKGPSADSGLRGGEFANAYCALWRLLNTVMRQTRCKDPSNKDLTEYGANCPDLGGRWSLLLPSNRCSTLKPPFTCTRSCITAVTSWSTAWSGT